MSVSHGVSILGADAFGVSSIIDALAQGGKIVAEKVQQDQATKASAADIAKRTDAVVSADVNFTAANTASLISTQALRDADPKNLSTMAALESRAQADAMARDNAAQMQDAVALGLPPEASAARLKKAMDAVTTAMKAAQTASQAYAAAPNDLSKKSAAQAAQFGVQAAQMTAAKAANNQIVTQQKPPTMEERKRGDEAAAAMEKHMKSSGNWFTAPLVGPIPAWGVGLGVVGIGGAVTALVLRRRR